MIDEMQKRYEHNATLGTRASVEIFSALAKSTFAEKHPLAYLELRHFKNDIAGSVEKVLNRSRFQS